MTPITVLGAGLAGLLAANMMKARFDAVGIIEKQPRLPNNHSAVLRFRSSVVGDVLNIPFKKVSMIKATVPWRNPVADALNYSFKNTGVYRSDRSVIDGLVTAERFIAPPDLIFRMSQGVHIDYDVDVQEWSEGIEPTISTLPMPMLMKILKYEKLPEFRFVSGATIKAQVYDADAFVSLIVPDPAFDFSRISLTGDELIIETPMDKIKLENLGPRWAQQNIADAAKLLGVRVNPDTMRMFPQPYAKIAPIPEEERKAFMYWATDKFNIFSLGRYATWRPGLLLDDLVKDIRLISGWIENGRYEMRKHRA